MKIQMEDAEKLRRYDQVSAELKHLDNCKRLVEQQQSTLQSFGALKELVCIHKKAIEALFVNADTMLLNGCTISNEGFNLLNRRRIRQLDR
jgi:hypothetical protein